MGLNIDKLKEIAVPRSEAAKESARTRRENREYLRKSSLETDEEQSRRLNNEEKQRVREKGKMMNEIQSYFKLYPELKETILNN